MHPHVRIYRIYARPTAADGAEMITHRILDAQGDKLQAAQRRTARGDIHAQGLIRRCPFRPRLRIGQAIHIVLAAIAPLRHLPQHPRGDAAF